MTTLSANSWTERIESASTLEELQEIHLQLQEMESTHDPDEYAPAGMSKLERDRLKTEESQEIGPLPDIKDPARRARCKLDLFAFIDCYFREACWRGLSPYQVEMVTAFQEVILSGGKKARAVRRGGLKSTLARIATVWSVVYGHRKFVVLVGATDDKSNEHRDNVLKMIRVSKQLLEDFPELIPLMMKRSSPKKGLRLDGALLEVTAKDSRGCILFPEIAGIESSEARIAPYSMQSTDVSGLSFVDDRGRTIRPDLLVFDDVQTPQSAKSYMMTSNRENAITTTFMGLAALGATIACIMVCTVREANDLTVRFCDRKLHPDWDGRMFPVLLSEPTDKQNWAIYGEKLRQGDTPEEGLAIATAHYRDNLDSMNAGGKVAWEDDKEDGYLTALQWCMTMSILQPEYFRCELQQKGSAPKSGTVQLIAEDLVKRLSNVERGFVPASASYLTAFVDSSDHVLWWMVCAWQKDFTGWVVDYGAWPDQGRQQFYKSDLQRTLEHELRGASWEEAFVHAHGKLDAFLFQPWKIEGGGVRELDIVLKDWSDGGQKRLVESQVNGSVNKSRIRPSKGFAPKPGKKPLHLYGDAKRDRHTNSHWVERRTEPPINIQFDANHWKNHVARRLRVIASAPTGLMLPGTDEAALMLLAEHLTAEIAKPIVYDGSPGVVYEAIPGRDNDWFDCLVGCAVGASVLGCSIPGEVVALKERRKVVLPTSRMGR